ncbi:MAG TPA: 30S ribosomal protein S2 [Sedimentisphaerales bacterium]|nr:30S ribosomal protein S2 [Sedimentisphaerales bacterium]
MAKELVRELINAGVHFGHGVSRWDPKMAPFIFAKRSNIHIIDIKKTLSGMLIAKKLLSEVVASGRDVVFVGTKRQAQKSVQAVAAKCGMHYVSHRWLGGTLTNFRTIRSQLQRLQELEAMQESGGLESESKKQASRLKREMRKIKSNLDGVRNMARLPGVVVVVDAKKEYLALREARKLGIATVGLIDTDSDPDSVDVAIPANDDSIRAVELILNELGDAVAIGKTMTVARREPVPRPRRVRPRRTAMASARSERAGAGPAPVEQAESLPAGEQAEDVTAAEGAESIASSEQGEAESAEPTSQEGQADEPTPAEPSS